LRKSLTVHHFQKETDGASCVGKKTLHLFPKKTGAAVLLNLCDVGFMSRYLITHVELWHMMSHFHDVFL